MDISDRHEVLNLMDRLWYMYNESVLPAYINRKRLSEGDIQNSMDRMERHAEELGLKCEFIRP